MTRLRPFFTGKAAESIPDSARVAKGEPIRIDTFTALLGEVAWLSSMYPHQWLFFRGQATDYVNRNGSSTLYPSIYRGEQLSRAEVVARFDVLESACSHLIEQLSGLTKRSYADLKRRKLIQWSVLQHYEICLTPLLDVTQSLRVACSFAIRRSTTSSGFVYILALPFVRNRISIDSEEDIVNVRLLSICPPEAKRPHFQEGFVIGTPDVMTDYDNKSELDFNRRLVAKFEIPVGQEFWGDGSDAIPEYLLYPENDLVLDRSMEIRDSIGKMARAGDVGTFVMNWSKVEAALRFRADTPRERVVPIGRSIENLLEKGLIDRTTALKIENLRSIRNRIVHRTAEIRSEDLSRAASELSAILDRLDIRR